MWLIKISWSSLDFPLQLLGDIEHEIKSLEMIYLDKYCKYMITSFLKIKVNYEFEM